MGAFFGSILIKTENSEAVRNTLERMAKGTDSRFLMGPALDGWISVFPNHAGQSNKISAEIASRLSNDIFHLQVHDDDIFAYSFYREGCLADQYDSCPDYFHEVSDDEKQKYKGRPELFQNLLHAPETLDRLSALLAAEKEKYIFEQDRMKEFVGLLRLQNAMASYEYLQSGLRNGITGWKQFVHIPDLTPEKNTKQAARAAVKAEKKRLEKTGILLAEIKPPEGTNSIAWSTNSSNAGILLTPQHMLIFQPAGEESRKECLSLRPPWKIDPEPIGLKIDCTAYVLCMSPSANWLASGFAFGDWIMRVWDWRRKELAFEVRHSGAVDSVAFSRDEQWVYSLSNELTISSLTERQPVKIIRGMEGARKISIHPSNCAKSFVTGRRI